MRDYEAVYEVLGAGIRGLVQAMSQEEMDALEEIRLRQGSPLQIKSRGKSRFLGEYRVSSKDIADSLMLISNYSAYAFEEEIRRGFITIRGGHRAGICGKVVMGEGRIQTIRSISSINLRLAHEVKNCGDGVLKYIIDRGELRHSLIASPPGCGKTTLLRDIIRQLSEGVPDLGFKGVDVAVVDERSEIAGSYMGAAQNDVGIRTDVLDSCPKALGMRLLLRSMSPSVVAVDEIGGREDIEAIEEMLNAGVKLISTVHGRGLEDIKRRRYLGALIEAGSFERIITLAAPGRVEAIYDADLNNIYEGEGGKNT